MRSAERALRQYVPREYESRAVEDARRVLLELTQLLDEYQEMIPVVGGWVPPLLMPETGHIGFMDVDLALNQEPLQEVRSETLRTL